MSRHRVLRAVCAPPEAIAAVLLLGFATLLAWWGLA